MKKHETCHLFFAAGAFSQKKCSTNHENMRIFKKSWKNHIKKYDLLFIIVIAPEIIIIIVYCDYYCYCINKTYFLIWFSCFFKDSHICMICWTFFGEKSACGRVYMSFLLWFFMIFKRFSFFHDLLNILGEKGACGRV